MPASAISSIWPPALQDATQPREDQELVDCAMLAWDAIRVPWLARCCFTAGCIDEATVWHYLEAAARSSVAASRAGRSGARLAIELKRARSARVVDREERQ